MRESQMFTIVAWIVFIIATGWNMIYFSIAAGSIMEGSKTSWRRESVTIVISLALWFVPGVYLFGWF
jgi:sulfite exporter TauE/SafE